MKHIFSINGDDKIILSAEGEKEQTLFNMVFPEEGEYLVEINGNTITIKKKPKS
jgi:hypothetical protein